MRTHTLPDCAAKPPCPRPAEASRWGRIGAHERGGDPKAPTIYFLNVPKPAASGRVVTAAVYLKANAGANTARERGGRGSHKQHAQSQCCRGCVRVRTVNNCPHGRGEGGGGEHTISPHTHAYTLTRRRTHTHGTAHTHTHTQHNTTQHNTTQHNTTQHKTTRHTL
jgi:hypothetical protein